MPRVIAEVDLIKGKYPEVKNKKAANAAAKAAGFKGSAAVKAGKVNGTPVIIVPQQPKKTQYKNKRPIVAETTGKKAYVVLKEKEAVPRVKKAPEPVPIVKSKAVPMLPKARGVPRHEKPLSVPVVVTKGSRLKEPQFAEIRAELNRIRAEIIKKEDIPKTLRAGNDVIMYGNAILREENKLFDIRDDLRKKYGFKDSDEEIIKIGRLIENSSLLRQKVNDIFTKNHERYIESLRKNPHPLDKKAEYVQAMKAAKEEEKNDYDSSDDEKV